MCRFRFELGRMNVPAQFSAHECESIDLVREQLEALRIDCNERHPHGALGNLTPREFAISG